MTGKLPYVKLRDGVYQFERRVPLAVQRRSRQFGEIFGGRPLFRRSLRTKDRRAMYAPWAEANAHFEDLVRRACHPPRAVADKPIRKVTDAELEAIVERYRQSVAGPFERAHLLAGSNPIYADELERMSDDVAVHAQQIFASLMSNRSSATTTVFQTPVDTARELVAVERLDAEEGSEEFGAIVSAIRAGKSQGYTRIDDLASGLATVKPKGIRGEVNEKGKITLREAVDRHQEFKGTMPAMRSEAALTLEIFDKVVGSKRLDDLTKSDFRAFAAHLGTLSVGGTDALAIARPLTVGTVKKRLGILSAAISHASDRDWFDGANPASNINLSAFVQKRDKVTMPDKRPFKVGELNRIFEHPWFTGCRSAAEPYEPGDHRLKGVEYWGVVVALYTGCRASELGGLKISEVLIDDPHPHIIIQPNEFRRIKGAEARNVPILDALMRLGFADYVRRIATLGSTRLFPDWKPKGGKDHGPTFNPKDARWAHTQMVRAFNRNIVPTALGDSLTPGARRAVTFHNLRGSFKTMLCMSERAINQNVIDDVVGHAKSGMDARYVGAISIEDTYRLVRHCDYIGLVIPPAP